MARRISDDVRLPEARAPPRLRRARGGLVRAAREPRSSGGPGAGSARSYRGGATRDEILARARELLAGARRLRATRRRRPRRAPAAGAAAPPSTRYEALKARAGALDFLDLLLRARDLVRDRADVRARARSGASRTSSSTSSRTPIRSRPRSCCCSRPTIPTSATGARCVRAPGKLFIVGDPKQSIYRFRRADVGDLPGGEGAAWRASGVPVVQLTSSFRARARDPAAGQRRVRAADAGGPRDAQAGYVPLAPCRERARRTSRPSSRCRCRARTATRELAKTAIDESLPDAVGRLRRTGW